jgi:hypothetical protein
VGNGETIERTPAIMTRSRKLEAPLRFGSERNLSISPEDQNDFRLSNNLLRGILFRPRIVLEDFLRRAKPQLS